MAYNHHDGLPIEKAVMLMAEFVAEHDDHAGYELVGYEDETWNGFMRCGECRETQIIRVDEAEYRGQVPAQRMVS
jgi:hypothetical protein